MSSPISGSRSEDSSIVIGSPSPRTSPPKQNPNALRPISPQLPIWDGSGEPPVAFLIAGAGGSVNESPVVGHVHPLGAEHSPACFNKRRASKELRVLYPSKRRIREGMDAEESPIDRFLRSTPPLERLVHHQMTPVELAAVGESLETDSQSCGEDTAVPSSKEATGPTQSLAVIEVGQVDSDDDEARPLPRRAGESSAYPRVEKACKKRRRKSK